MKNFKTLMPIFALVFFGAMHLPKAKADDWDQKTILTFTEPVELPGVVLPAGTYVFKLADPWAVRDVVQVFNENETKLVTTLLAIPTYRMKSTDRDGVTFFEERPAGSREAIKAWFYHGRNYGEEFVYPQTGSMELAKASNQPLPSTSDETAANITEPAPPAEVQEAPTTEMQPMANEAQFSEIQLPELPAPTETTTSATRLPKTASQLPWFLLIGIMSLAGSLVLRVSAKKSL